MSMIRWDPFADISQLREQMNRLFEQSLTRTGNEPVARQTWAPAVDICETEDALVLQMDVAGVRPEEIDIQISGDTLIIKGERKFKKDADGKQYVRVERAYGAFQRSFTLGVPVEQGAVQATYRDGILEVTLPKREEVRPKQVKITVQQSPEPQTLETS